MNRHESKVIAGAAIIMMILLHTLAGTMFTLKSILVDDKVITQIAQVGKICVSLYAFCSGYGMWKSYCLKTDWCEPIIKVAKETYNRTFIRLIKFYIAYFPFCIVGAVVKWFGEKSFNVIEFIENVIGLSFSYNAAWWYVRYYVFMILVIFPVSVLIYQIAYKIAGGGITRIFGIAILVVMSLACIPIAYRFTGALCIIVFCSGEICVQIELLEYIRNRQWLTIFCFIVGCVIRMMYTDKAGTLMLDPLCVPLIIPGVLTVLNRVKFIDFMLYNFGVHSTSMWLMHTFLYLYSDWINVISLDGVMGFIVVLLSSYSIALIWDRILDFVKIRIRKNLMCRSMYLFNGR